jgi:hypothetical protein
MGARKERRIVRLNEEELELLAITVKNALERHKSCLMGRRSLRERLKLRSGWRRASAGPAADRHYARAFSQGDRPIMTADRHFP